MKLIIALLYAASILMPATSGKETEKSIQAITQLALRNNEEVPIEPIKTLVTVAEPANISLPANEYNCAAVTPEQQELMVEKHSLPMMLIIE